MGPRPTPLPHLQDSGRVWGAAEASLMVPNCPDASCPQTPGTRLSTGVQAERGFSQHPKTSSHHSMPAFEKSCPPLCFSLLGGILQAAELRVDPVLTRRAATLHRHSISPPCWGEQRPSPLPPTWGAGPGTPWMAVWQPEVRLERFLGSLTPRLLWACLMKGNQVAAGRLQP